MISSVSGDAEDVINPKPVTVPKPKEASVKGDDKKLTNVSEPIPTGTTQTTVGLDYGVISGIPFTDLIDDTIEMLINPTMSLPAQSVETGASFMVIVDDIRKNNVEYNYGVFAFKTDTLELVQLAVENVKESSANGSALITRIYTVKAPSNIGSYRIAFGTKMPRADTVAGVLPDGRNGKIVQQDFQIETYADMVVIAPPPEPEPTTTPMSKSIFSNPYIGYGVAGIAALGIYFALSHKTKKNKKARIIKAIEKSL